MTDTTGPNGLDPLLPDARTPTAPPVADKLLSDAPTRAEGAARSTSPLLPPPSLPGLKGAVGLDASPHAHLATNRGGHWRRLWMVLALIAAMLLAAGGGVAYEIGQYKGPANVVSQFCGDIKARHYASVYTLLATEQRDRFTTAAYVQLLAQLDTLEGTAATCGQASGSGAYQFHLGAGTAIVTVVLTRAHQGALRGGVHLVREGGSWRIAGIDTSLLGINLSALQVADAYCQALRAQDYKTAYSLLSSAARDEANASQYQSLLHTQDQVDGKVSVCVPTGLGPTNTDATSHVVVDITRAKLGKRQGTLALTQAKGSWAIATVDPQLEGTSLGALFVAVRWCGDINAGNYADAYSLSVAKTQMSLAQFQSTLDGWQTIQGQTFFFQWTVCKADPTTYTVNGSTATITAAVTWVITVNGQTSAQNYSVPLDFTRFGTSWLWNDIGTPTPS